MALKARSGITTGDSVQFWESVAQKFGQNDLVFYELYNEPHLKNTTADLDVYLNGNDVYAGMIEMSNAVRKYSTDSVLVIAGSQNWAYDANSNIALDKLLDASN